MTKTDDWVSQADKVLDKALEASKTDPMFSKEEIGVLKDVINGYRGVRSFIRFGKWTISLLAALALGITATRTLTGEVLQWLGK